MNPGRKCDYRQLVHSLMKLIYFVLFLSEELQGAMNAFSEWMDALSPTGENINFMWEEYEDRQPELNKIYEKVKHVEPHFNDAYTELVAKYQVRCILTY